MACTSGWFWQVVPRRFQLVSNVHELTIRWRWLSMADIAVCALLSAFLVFWFVGPGRRGDAFSTGFSIVLVVVSLGIGCRVLMGFLNHTSLSAADSQVPFKS